MFLDFLTLFGYFGCFEFMTVFFVFLIHIFGLSWFFIDC